MLVVAECAANCVIVSVVISYGSQCQLLTYYLNGIISRLEEKNTELRYIMKVSKYCSARILFHCGRRAVFFFILFISFILLYLARLSVRIRTIVNRNPNICNEIFR